MVGTPDKEEVLFVKRIGCGIDGESRLYRKGE
jgi:hypothetical protein